MIDHYWNLLLAATQQPDTPLHALALTSEHEDDAIASNPMPVDEQVCVHQLFEAQVDRTPDATAASHDGGELTYRELDERANRLAHMLIEHGARPGELVGINLERSLDMLVAVLAVQKTGAAYVPLDPGFPQDRLEYMLADSQSALLVTQSSLPASLDGPMAIQVDDDASAIAAQPSTRPDVAMSADDLIYVIYTSGSTGRPKGVQLEHRSVVNFLTSMATEPGITSDDVLVAVTTLSFDIAVLELYLPLLHGAQVVIADRSAAVDAAALSALLDASNATIMQATPTTWRLLLEFGWEGRSDLVALCGGEALPKDLAVELSPRCRELWNMYGPTETTVWSSVWRVDPEATVLIGHPIGNTTLHVVDSFGNTQPAGIPGELLIGGKGLARGYLDRPELTDEKFELEPDTGNRLYRTGDLAVQRYDGQFECLGRIDSQVKVRGYRIELGEIEAALATYELLTEAVVSTHEVQPGDVRLAAYFVQHDDAPALRPEELRSHLGRTLPDYMIPSTFTRIDAVPLTPNKKVDRLALPAPEAALAPTDNWEAPASELERQLARIWERNLGVTNIGRNQNFFDLGGHSLLAVRVFAQLEDMTGRSYPVTALFRGPTIAELAAVIRTETWSTPFTSLVAVQPNGSKRPVFSVSPFLITPLSYHLLARTPRTRPTAIRSATAGDGKRLANPSERRRHGRALPVRDQGDSTIGAILFGWALCGQLGRVRDGQPTPTRRRRSRPARARRLRAAERVATATAHVASSRTSSRPVSPRWPIAAGIGMAIRPWQNNVSGCDGPAAISNAESLQYVPPISRHTRSTTHQS